MEEWIRTTFEVIPGGFDYDGDIQDAFAFESSSGTRVEASIPRFVQNFGGAAVPPSVEALKAEDPTDTKGWHQHFDAWKQQGILP